METPYSEEPEQSQEEAIEIYSRQAIVGFSIFFSALFGGALLCINLWNVGLKKAAGTVLAFSVVFTILSSILMSSVGSTNSFAAIGCNVLGAMILGNYFFPKYFPENDYYPKPIWGALAISIIVSLTIFLLMYYSGGFPELNKVLLKK